MSIALEHVNYIYSPGTAYEKRALNDISLEIGQGQFVGIIGHTGSGKSTLIQHLNGLMKATSGVTYEGQTVRLKGTNGGIQLQLYQDGYDKHDPITVYAGQDGEFQAVLFDGEYKLVTKDKNGPWVNSRDTIYVTVKGTTDCEVKVTPYFMISEEDITMADNTVTATCNVNQIVDGAKIGQAMLLVSKTSFVDEATNIARQNKANVTAGKVDFSLDVSSNANVKAAKALYGRIGVKPQGADQAIYSQVFRLK